MLQTMKMPTFYHSLDLSSCTVRQLRGNQSVLETIAVWYEVGHKIWLRSAYFKTITVSLIMTLSKINPVISVKLEMHILQHNVQHVHIYIHIR
jgi:hypothetical protein